MSGLLMLFFLGLGSTAGAAELKRAGFQGGHVYNKHDLFIPEYTDYEMGPVARHNQSGTGKPERWAYELRLFMDIDLYKSKYGTFYWNNDVIGMSTTRQFRYVSWDFETGYQFNKRIGLFYHHQSEHVLERERNSYPMHDVMGIRFCFGGSKC